MRVTEENMIELAVNEMFDYKGTAMRVVEDSWHFSCEGCCEFYKNRGCEMFACTFKDREDDTDVHFVKASGRRKTAKSYKKMKILHLHLMFKYYDQIKYGDKREEYRNFGWLERTCQIRDTCWLKGFCCNKDCYYPDDYTHVCFWRGYTSERMYWKIDEIKIDVGRSEWGASNGTCLVIKFHERTGYEP